MDGSVVLRTCTLAPRREYNGPCASFGPPKSTIQKGNRSVQPFLHSSRQKVPILYNGRFFPQNCPFHGGAGPPSNTLVHWTSRSSQPKRHLDRFSRFVAGLTSVTDRPTDRPTDHATRSVTIDRIYVRSTCDAA